MKAPPALPEKSEYASSYFTMSRRRTKGETSDEPMRKAASRSRQIQDAGEAPISERETRERGGSKAPCEETATPARHKVKFEVYGEEMLEKEVKFSGNSGRVYLPPEWVGKQIKVIRTN